MTDDYFRVTARTVLQLGAELISSDGVALYELVKNGLDAQSPRVRIAFSIRLQSELWPSVRGLVLAGGDAQSLARAKDSFAEAINLAVEGSDALRDSVENATTWKTIRRCFDEANDILVSDTGNGMSEGVLRKAFLTIGTQIKLEERRARRASGKKGPPILGEKGVGRLSAMRLGSQLLVTTTTSEESHWHTLQIDWRRFEEQAGHQLDKVPVQLAKGALKADPSEQGTRLKIWGLSSGWSVEETKKVVDEEVARFADPFSKAKGPVRVTRNKEAIVVPRIADALFPSAHAYVEANYEIRSDGPSVDGEIDYRLRSRQGPIELTVDELLSLTSAPLSVLKSLGPFRLTLYWWNRGLLTPIDTIGDTTKVRRELDRWAGGIAVYRDGFRVAPYGAMDDDWLDLDRQAFRSRAYKLNRGQIIAKVDITSDANPRLVDQTNREGLQHTSEFQALRTILKSLLESTLRPFLEKADEEYNAQNTEPIAAMKERSRVISVRVRRSLKALKRTAPQAVDDSEIAEHVDALVKQMNSVLRNTSRIVETSGLERERLTTLAGMGLMVEVVAHELNRSTQNAVTAIQDAARLKDPQRRQRALDVLSGELKTLQKRISVLDELSVSGRQRKSEIDLVGWIEAVVEEWHPKFERHGVAYSFRIVPANGPKSLRVSVVKGMLVQILGNLLANSTYWLAQVRRRDPSFRPRIDITVDTNRHRVTLTDNGPGIPDGRSEAVFQPFVTTKPPGRGRGLGLFIAREIAKYHKGSLYLAEEPRIHPGRRNTFVFELNGEHVG